MAEKPAAGFYRKQAARLRDMALESNHPTFRFELLELAAQFEKLADFAERALSRH
ncbi:MAG: hypothetical protein KGL11_05665 [Alphaproteobacteria bacterium]|nr:hypothetical protein [Alphaproteobacteria bacterium]